MQYVQHAPFVEVAALSTARPSSNGGDGHTDDRQQWAIRVRSPEI
jgi:hypothetical protein